MSLHPAVIEGELLRADAAIESADVAVVPEFQFREMWRIIRQRWLLVAGLALSGALLALAISLAMKKSYSSTAIIEVIQPTATGTGLNDLSGIAAGAGGEELATELATQEAIIKSGSVALTVAKELNLAATPAYQIPADEKTRRSPLFRERDLPLDQAPLQQERIIAILRSHLKVALVRDTRLLSVTYTDQSPEEAARVANAVVRAYTLEYSRARLAASAQAFSGLSDQLGGLKSEVFESQRKVAEYEQKTGIVIPPTAGTAASDAPTTGTDTVSMNRFIELNRELTAAQVARIAREAIYRMAEARDPDLVLGAASSQLASSAGENSVLSPGSADLALLASLREQRSRLSLRRASDLERYGAKNPLLIDLENESRELNQQITQELDRIQQRAKSDFELARANEAGLEAQVARQRQEVTKVSSDANQLLLLAQEQASSRQLYQDLYAKLEEARVAAGLRNSNITVIDPARMSTIPSAPVPSRNVLIGFFAGAMLGVFLAFLLDGLDDRLRSPDQVARRTAIPVIANLPLFDDGGRVLNGGTGKLDGGTNLQKRPWLLAAPGSMASEAVRSLRSGLLLRSGPGSVRSILFTSSASGEGKSTLCFNTAVAFALQGEKILLIDANLRRPSIHALAQLANDRGLSQYLHDGLPLSEVVQPYRSAAGLCVLPSGGRPEMPSELLGSVRFRELLREGTERFDRVLIDSSSLLSATDPVFLSGLVDCTVVVVRSSETTGEMLKRALANPGLRAAHLRVALNGVDPRSANFPHGAAEDGYETV